MNLVSQDRENQVLLIIVTNINAAQCAMFVVINSATSTELSNRAHAADANLDPPTMIGRKRRSEIFQSFSASKRKLSPVTSLRDFLKKKSRFMTFRAFLQKEFSEENLDFWIEVETYRKRKQAKQSKMAHVIYETYIRPGAKREINIDSQTRRETETNLAGPDSVTFDLAQKHVQGLMEKDSFRRFLVQERNFVSGEMTAPRSGHLKSVVKNDRPALRFSLSLRAGIIERRRRRSAAA